MLNDTTIHPSLERSYPVPTGPGLHLRVYPSMPPASTRSADMTSVAVEHLARGAHVVFFAQSNPSDIMSFMQTSWGNENLRVVRTTDLVAATAELYRALIAIEARAALLGLPHSPSDSNLVVIIEDITSLETSPHGGHDDAVAASWLQAVIAGNDVVLEGLTGLSGDIYSAKSLVGYSPTIVAGTYFRRCPGAVGERSLVNVLGASTLLNLATTVVELRHSQMGDAEIVTQKNRDASVPPVAIHRDAHQKFARWLVS